MKLYFKETLNKNNYTIQEYNSVNRLPLSIKKTESNVDIAYIQLLDKNYFFEIGINQKDNEFISLDIIFINNTIVYEDEKLEKPQLSSKYFVFFLQSIENKTIKEIRYYKDVVEIIFLKKKVEFLPITESFFIGVDGENNLTSILLSNIDVNLVIGNIS